MRPGGIQRPGFALAAGYLLCSPRKDEYGNHVLLRGGKKRSRCNIPWPRGAAKYFSQEAPAIAHGFKNMSENAPNHSKPSENRLDRRPPSSRLGPLEKTVFPQGSCSSPPPTPRRLLLGSELTSTERLLPKSPARANPFNLHNNSMT